MLVGSVIPRASLRTSRCEAVHSHRFNSVPRRRLNVHEFQSQDIMRGMGVTVPPGGSAKTPEEAESVAKSLNTNDLIVKAQILAGGRGLGTFDSGLKGGVHPCNSPQEAKEIAAKMLGHTLVTKQTGIKGLKVATVLVAKRLGIKKETYFAILLDRASQGPMIIASSKGGVDIEKVAAEDPSAIIKEKIDVFKGPTPQQIKNIAQGLGFSPHLYSQVEEQVSKLYSLFKEKDATMVEVNPFVETADGQIMCMDAKINFDDNSAFRQKETFAMEDKTQKDSREVDAAKFDLNYIGLDGNIGCLVNGAGLAMATMDIIKLYGGEPANFLDIGGGATTDQVREAIKILTKDKRVTALLVNIFGGIMKCDTVAEGLIAAAKEVKVQIPLVVRLQGTNVERAKQIMKESGMKIITADDLDDAAKKAVESLKTK